MSTSKATKMETAILVLVLVGIIVSAGSLYYMTNMTSKVRSDVSTLRESVTELASTMGGLATTMGDLAEAVGEYSETIAALEQRIRAIEEAIKPPLVEQILRVARYGDIAPGLDPHTTIEWMTGGGQILVYEGLLRYKAGTLEIEPNLAVDWEVSADKKEYTFYLREEVKFHDGTPFNATAVKFSYDRLMTLKTGPIYLFGELDRVEVLDTYKVKFVLKRPFIPFLEVMANYWGNAIISPTAVMEHEKEPGELAREWLIDHEAGTGPYMLERWTRGEEAVFVKFPDYWRGWEGKHIEKVILKVVKEPATQRMLLERGDIDIASELALADVQDVSATEGVIVKRYHMSRMNHLRITVLHPPLDDVRVREAISWAFDYDRLVSDILVDGLGGVQKRGPIPQGLDFMYYDETLPMYQRDVDKALALLEEAGWVLKDGVMVNAETGEPMRDLRFTYAVGLLPTGEIGELLASNLMEIGITVKVEGLPVGTLLEEMADPDRVQDFFAIFYDARYGKDPHLLREMYHADAVLPRGWNIGWYNNTEVNRLLDDGAVELDPVKREEMYKTVQKILVDECATIWLYQVDRAIGLREWVKGYTFTDPYGFHPDLSHIYDVYIEK